MDDGIGEMARRYCGYGRWEAPFWFIGPESGQAREENNDLNLRREAWLYCGGGELSDIRDFHVFLNRRARHIVHPWFEKSPPFQSSIRPLMLLLMAFLQRPADNDNLRIYQRDRWGRLDGETCSIHLSGLAANSLQTPRDRELFRRERIAVIRQRMRTQRPALVVMYGTSVDTRDWEEIAGGAFPPDNIRRFETTILAVTRHPSRSPNAYWAELGDRLRQVVNGS